MRLRPSLTNYSIAGRYALAAAIAALAALGHWTLFPYTAGRVPFLLFLPSIIVAAVFGGRGPGLLVLVAGLLNASLQLMPVGSIAVAYSGDRVAVLAYVLTGLFLVFIGYQLRVYAQREYENLREVNELSAALAPISDLHAQLDLVLRTLARMHDTDRGLVSLCDMQTQTLRVEASLGFSSEALNTLKQMRIGDGASGLACLDAKRVVIENVTRDARFAPYRDLAAREGFCAVHSTPMIGRSGDILGAITVYLNQSRSPTKREMSLADICARKAAVAIERAAAEATAREGERRFRTVIEASSVPFTILEPVRDASGTITDFRWNYVNAEAGQVLGHAPDELVGRRIGEVLPGTWDEPELFKLYVSAVEQDRRCTRELKSQANGVEGWFQIVGSPLDGKLAVWFADITERKRQEEALREADRRKDEFLATLAHELRNPLAPIRQASTIAASDRASGEQREWAFSVIRRQVEHMALLLDDLLDISRITRGTLTLRKQTVELRSVVSAAAETARPLIDARHHQFQVDVPDSLSLVADPLRLSQILANLLTNAAKYTPPGGKIRLSAVAEGHCVCVRVEDNGIGLRAADMPLLFQMFSQVRSVAEHAQGGLGIGLALTRGLVEMHGGRIDATSAGPGHGTTFVVRLPIGEIAHAKARGADGGEPRLVISRRVLVADDNKDAAESLAMLLRLEGHEVVIAGDGASAIRLFGEHAPEVAILDIGMPDMNGYEVARHIRTMPHGSGALLIALTGWGQEKDRRASHSAGFDHHLTKPVEPGTVAELVARPGVWAVADG